MYVHDSSDTNSFSYISNLRQQYAGGARGGSGLGLDRVPSLFVATKSDLDLALQVGLYFWYSCFFGRCVGSARLDGLRPCFPWKGVVLGCWGWNFPCCLEG